jgi:oligoribonuclease
VLRYAAIDVETTGLDPDTCQIIELAVVVETDWTTPVDQLPTLHLLVEHEEYAGSAVAIAMNARVFAELAKNSMRRATSTVTGDELILGIEAFLAEHLGPAPWVAGGKNAGTFDLRFLRRLPDFDPGTFRHRVIDPAVLWTNPATDAVPPDLPTCLNRAGLTNDRPHHPVSDCRAVIELVRAGFARRSS